MKTRNIPFGYRYVAGSIEIHPREREILLQIWNEYLDGQSLLSIANQLNTDGIEYRPGVINWNKARLKRILDDKRYLGQGKYPSILDGETYARLQTIKASRNTQKDYDRNAGIFRIKAPALCPSCGYKMRRTHDARRTDNTERWICQNPDCKRSMAKTDEDLIGEITELLNMTIADPEMIQTPLMTDNLADRELQKIDKEIDRMLIEQTPDKGTLRYAMLRRVSLAYANIPNEIYISKQLRADFANAKPLSSVSSDLFHKTVKAILFHEDGTVGILLINDQEIRKAKSNGKDRAAAESGTANPCDS